MHEIPGRCSGERLETEKNVLVPGSTSSVERDKSANRGKAVRGAGINGLRRISSLLYWYRMG